MESTAAPRATVRPQAIARWLLIVAALVFAMAAMTAMFFFVVDEVIGLSMRAIFGGHL